MENNDSWRKVNRDKIDVTSEINRSYSQKKVGQLILLAGLLLFLITLGIALTVIGFGPWRK